MRACGGASQFFQRPPRDASTVALVCCDRQEKKERALTSTCPLGAAEAAAQAGSMMMAQICARLSLFIDLQATNRIQHMGSRRGLWHSGRHAAIDDRQRPERSSRVAKQRGLATLLRSSWTWQQPAGQRHGSQAQDMQQHFLRQVAQAAAGRLAAAGSCDRRC